MSAYMNPSNAPKAKQFANFLLEVQREIERARTKFPYPAGSMTALTEEVGELAKALLDEDWDFVKAEAIQVACMAARVAVEGDPTLRRVRATRWKRRASRPMSAVQPR